MIETESFFSQEPSSESLPENSEHIPTLPSSTGEAPESGVRRIIQSDFYGEGSAPVSSPVDIISPESASSRDTGSMPPHFKQAPVPDYELRTRGTVPMAGDRNLPPSAASRLEEEEPAETLKAA